VKIFLNKFKLINLYRLRHMRELQFNKLNDINRIEIENEMLKLKKTSRIYKNFNKTFHEIWSKFFLNYIFIMISLFEKIVLNLHAVLTIFHNDVYQLSRVYEWQNVLLLITIEMHTHIITTPSFDLVKWVIRLEFQERFCNSMTIIDYKRKWFAFLNRDFDKFMRSRNDLFTICENFNKSSCF
jgi:hypothetical protein